MLRIISLLIGYAIGCVQTAYFVGKAHGIDIREHGSKNAGMSNVTRTVGKRAGLAVFLIDIFKAMLAFAIASFIFGAGIFGAENGSMLPGIYAGVGAVLGHCFPFFLKFRGGKGISCTAGLIIILDWRIAAILLAGSILIVLITRYISLVSLFVTLFAPILMFFFGHEVEAITVMAANSALTWFLHRGNIKRLIAGNERKFLKKELPQPPADDKMP